MKLSQIIMLGGIFIISNQKFITDILNINYDQIESIDSIKNSDHSINFFVKLKPVSNLRCPYCDSCHIVGNGFTKRKLIHSTLVNRKCIIFYKRRRYLCKDCSSSFSEKNPFINTGESVTLETKINVLKDLKFVANTYSAVAARYNISVTKVIQIFDKHVDIKRKPLPEVLSIDEHFFPQSNYDSLYMCIFMDFITGEIVDVLPDRKKAYIANYLSVIRTQTLNKYTNKSELHNVKYVSIDLYDNYRDIAHIYFPKAIVCADPFHVLKHLTEGFNQVRLRCRRETQDEDIQYLLTKFKNIFKSGFDLDNKAKYNKRFKRYLNYRDILTILFDRFPDLKTAYELKEKYIFFNRNTSLKEAEKGLADLILEFGDSGIEEYHEFYNLLINWNKEIINSFTIINSRRINNSFIESRNNQIERLIYNAYGYTNSKRARNRIMYCLNKKDSYKI